MRNSPLLLLTFIWGCAFLSTTAQAEMSSAVDCWIPRFLKTILPETAPLLEGAPRESDGIIRKQIAIRGRYTPEVSMTDAGTRDEIDLLTLQPKAGKSLKLGEEHYIEFPNSTAVRVKPILGEDREYLLTRGVREYKNKVRKDGTQSPQQYTSDVLLFERGKDGKFRYIKTILKSAPEKGFLFEDPRVSVIYGSTGKAHFLLSGTDYSPHVPGSANPDVMNLFVPLEVDRNGAIQTIKVDPRTAKPDFFDMSPAPQLRSDGSYSFVDAKNGTIARNEKGEIVVRLRLRPDFGDPEVKKLANGKSWHYGEQVYVFKNWKDFRRYEWKYALQDLFHPNAPTAGLPRIKPRMAKEIIRDENLKELFKDNRIVLEKGKGLGPGTIPVRVRRDGNKLYISNGVGAHEEYAGTLSKDRLARFILKDGEVKFLAPDHEIRYFKQDSFLKRHYSNSFKLFNDELTHIDAYYADAIQPKTPRERGMNSGIVDLQHTYPMGRTIVPGQNNGKATVRIYSGTSDANTSQYDMDVLKVLTEMSEGSERRVSGQVYVPGLPTESR